MRVENQIKPLAWDDLSSCQKPRLKNVVQEFHFWISLICRLTVFPRCWARCRCRGDPLLATSTTWRLWAILCTIYRNRKSRHYSLRSRKNVFHIKNCYNQQDSLRCEHYIGVVVQWKNPIGCLSFQHHSSDVRPSTRMDPLPPLKSTLFESNTRLCRLDSDFTHITRSFASPGSDPSKYHYAIVYNYFNNLVLLPRWW